MNSQAIDVTTVPVPKDAPHFDGTNNANQKSSVLVDVLLCFLITFGGIYAKYSFDQKRKKSRAI